MKLDFLLQSGKKHTVLNEKAFSPFAWGPRCPIPQHGHSLVLVEGSGIGKVLEQTWQPPLLGAAAAVGAHTNRGAEGPLGFGNTEPWFEVCAADVSRLRTTCRRTNLIKEPHLNKNEEIKGIGSKWKTRVLMGYNLQWQALAFC